MPHQPRDSRSHPLQIATVAVGKGYGRIGVSFCPGKQQTNALSGSWTRSLEIDIAAIKAWGAQAVVTLIEPHEMTELKVENIGHVVAHHGMQWFHLPIRDVTAPGPAFEDAWREAGPQLRTLLRSGRDVFVHCKGGLGRAGTVAARLLVELGWDATAAIAAVRAARPGALETSAQEDHVHAVRAVDDQMAENSRAAPSDAKKDRAIGCLLGLAAGDAVGTTLEFKPRDSYPPLTDMVGGGPFGLKPGEWTDDTSMALALAESLSNKQCLDADDLMARFVSWWRRGEYSVTGRCFDIGITTSGALARYERTGNAVAGSTDAGSAGNGSLMRLAPIAIWGVREGTEHMRAAARAQSATTHGAAACLDACEGYALILHAAINGATFEEAVAAGLLVDAAEPIRSIFEGSWRHKDRGQIKSSGYVAHSLEAALWCVSQTGNFREAVLLAANLGDDADTTAAIVGQLAGALYGVSGIPAAWRERLAWRERMTAMATSLL